MVFVNGFCGNSTFWDSNISWNTTSPDLSNCFKSTVLVWVPCAVFWTWTMYELTIAYRSRNRPNKWSFLHIVKQILNTGMLLLSVVKFISSIVIYSEEDNRHIELSNVIGNSIESVTYILVVLLTAYSRRKGILVSNALPLFWILQSAYYASLTYSNYNRTNENFSLEQLTIIVDLISTAISPLMLILSSFCETPSSFEVLNNEDDIQENCPGKKNSLFSFVTFSWANKIIINGLKSTFQIDQLDPLCKELRSAVVTKIYDRSFQNSARAIRDRDSDPEVLIQRPVKTPLVKTLWKISWWPFILGAIFELIAIFLTFCPPYLLSKLLNFVDSTELNWHGYVYAILFWLIIIIESIVDSLSQYFCMVASVQVKNALISAVYRKILLLSNSAKTKYTAGEIVNLMAIDSQEIFEFTTYVYQFLGIPLRISLTLWYLWYYLGPSSLASLAVFAVLSPISSVLGVKVDYYQEQVMLQKDKRLKQMSEILNGIKILKLYAWEKPFIKQVLETRSEELSYLKKGAYLNSFFAFLWIVAPFLVCIVCFTTFLLSNTSHQLTAEIAFVSLSLIGLLRFPMGVLPDLLTRFIKGRTAYVPQQAWIQNATLQQNIIFRKSYSQRLYTQILDKCELRADLELLSGGDMTEIGEKGINLSGGQKQRVSLARAVYQDEDIYLLDDPLSAVDANVAAKLFKGVIGHTGLLKKKTRILATHNISFLSETDHIIVMSEGEIAEQGSYNTLMSNGGKFSEFLKEHMNQDSKEEDRKSQLSIEDQIKRQVSVLSNESIPHEQDATIDRLTEEETMQLGKVKWEVYSCYIKHLGLGFFFVTFLVNMVSAVLETGSGLWLSRWSTNTDGLSSQITGLGIYLGFILGLAVAIFFCYTLLFYGAVKAAKSLHSDLLTSVIKCPLSFFDTTPTGRILNRFSKDIESVDAELPWSMGNMLNMLCWLPMIFILISLSSIYILPFMLATLLVYAVILRYYIKTNNQLRRFDSVSRSPVYSNFTETIQGTSSIRAYNAQQYFINRSHQRVDENMKCYYSSQLVSRWLDVVLAILSSNIILATAILAILERDTINVGILGLALTYCIELSQGLGYLVKTGAVLESQVVGVERIREYSILKPEAEWEISDTKPTLSWPDNGLIEITNYTASYREGLDPVLVNINLKIMPRSKVGIVGRTGAGKSSFILSLFRIIEPTNGYIKIDGVNIHNIGTHDLRSKLTIIPQDPVLFAGTLRLNLDPWNERTDDEIWTSLERSHLKTFVTTLENGLEFSITEGGENLSGGQRQLVCLARALLRSTQILILDEATASVDLDTDNLIQATVREAFASCTVITIAHRLHTIMKCDKIICFSKGTVVEEGSPDELLQKTESHFYSMAKDAGLV